MTEKAKPKGLRPLSLNPLTTSPLMTLLPVTGNRIYRAEEATAPAEGQTLLLVNPAATESTSPVVVSASQLVPVILPLDLSVGLGMDSMTAERQSAGQLPTSQHQIPQPPLSGGLLSQPIAPP